MAEVVFFRISFPLIFVTKQEWFATATETISTGKMKPNRRMKGKVDTDRHEVFGFFIAAASCTVVGVQKVVLKNHLLPEGMASVHLESGKTV